MQLTFRNGLATLENIRVSKWTGTWVESEKRELNGIMVYLLKHETAIEAFNVFATSFEIINAASWDQVERIISNKED